MNQSSDQSATQNNGASKASDFQPTTQNPQNIETDLFQQQGGLQNVTNSQELLSDTQGRQLVVNNTAIPNTTSTEVSTGSTIDWDVVLAVVALILFVTCAFVYARLKRLTQVAAPPRQRSTSATKSSDEQSKPGQKKKKSRKKKRRNR